MKAIITAVGLLLAPFVAAYSLSESMLSTEESSIQGELYWTGVIDLGEISENAEISVTQKGNGWLSIANIKVKVYDDHNDGLVYENQMLDVDFIDFSGDKISDIVIHGMVLHYDEKGEAVKWEESVVFMYRFNPDTVAFERVYISSSFDLE